MRGELGYGAEVRGNVRAVLEKGFGTGVRIGEILRGFNTVRTRSNNALCRDLGVPSFLSLRYTKST